MPTKTKARAPRAPNLTDEGIERVVLLIDAWTEPKLTWDLLIALIHKKLGARYTRQTLDRHTRISAAFQQRKKQLSGQPRPISPDKQRIAALEAENARLRQENHNLLEQFHRWLYNAQRINIKLWEEDWRQHRQAIREELDKALPPAKRRGSVSGDKP